MGGSHVMLGLGEVARRAGISGHKIDRWINAGAVTIESYAVEPGIGNHREFTFDEMADISLIAELERRAKAAGLTMSYGAIGDAWNALQTGRPWRLVLDIDEVTT